MTEEISQHHVNPPGMADNPEPKRRKVRKGTQSCWECKRRKTRCTFSAPPNSTCDGCKSRKTLCVGQEFPDTTAASSKGKGDMDRIARVEAMMNQLAKKNGIFGLPVIPPESLPHARRPVYGKSTVAVEPSSGSMYTPTLDDQQSQKDNKITKELLIAWPSQHDLEIILNVQTGTSGLTHGLVCTSLSTMLTQELPLLRDLLELPPEGSHPVLFARRFLILAIFLQGVPPSTYEDLKCLTTDYRHIMSHAVDTAHRVIVSNDDLVDSIEGIECIMMHSMYQNNAGNLRLAWLANRRAMLIAQTMGLHRRTKPFRVKILDPSTSSRISPEHMWIRLVISDRYFSLMVGLPQGSPESNFATPEAMENCSPMERLGRLDSLAGSRILQRNDSNMLDLTTTMEIDKILQEAAACMTAQWWLIPTLDSSSKPNGDMETVYHLVRTMNHFAHYNILVHLHLPYLLLPSENHEYDYSKMTIVNASRELLTRFISLRSANLSTCYCRGIDFIAFIASMALCLAHINAHTYQTQSPHNAFAWLAHQGHNDRGLIERTLELMKSLAIENDKIASRIADILEHLLGIEADASKGVKYSTSSILGRERDDGEELGCNGALSDGGKVLDIFVPYYGTVKIERGVLSIPKVPESTEPQLQDERGHNWPVPDVSNSQLFGSDDWTLQGVDMAFCESLLRGTQGADEEFLMQWRENQ